MGTRPGGRMVAVELVEDDGIPPSSDALARGPGHVLTGTSADGGPTTSGVPAAEGSGGPEEPAGPGPGRSRGVRRLAAVAAVAVLAATILLAGRDGDPEPTASGPLAAPMAERWSESADDVVAVVDGLVVVTNLASQTPGLRALDVATGEEVWRVPFGRSGVADGCLPGLTQDPPTVWCWRERRVQMQDDGRFGFVPAALVGVSARDGEVLAVHETRDQSAGYAVVGEDLVLGQRRDGQLTLRRVHAATWELAWETRLALEPRTPGGAYVARIAVAHDLVVVRGPTTAVVDATDGTVLRTWAPATDGEGTALDGADVVVTPTGFAAWTTVVAGSRLDEGVWHDRSGEPVSGFRGRLVEPAETDGSVPRVLLVARDGQLVGLDASSGADLWRIPVDGVRVAARRAGQVVLVGPDSVRSVEALTGIVRWEQEVPGLRTGVAAATDGEVVVVTSVRDNLWVATAFRTGDGAVLWARQVPGTAEITFLAYPPAYQVVAGRPVVWVGRTLVWVSC